MGLQPIGKRVVYEGRKVALELHEFADEGGLRLTKEVCRHPGAVIVLAFLDAETILLVRNRRWPIGGQWLLELPAGTLEPPEPPIACAARELEEEAGYRAGRIEPLAGFYTAPGLLGELMHAFVATDLTHVGVRHEPGEEIEVVTLAYAEALRMIDAGELTDGKSIAALLMYDRRPPRGTASPGASPRAEEKPWGSDWELGVRS